MAFRFGKLTVIPSSTPRRFWGPNGLGQLPYFSKELGDSTTAGGFFARMVGLGFMIMFLGTTQFSRLDRRALSRNVPRNKTNRTRPRARALSRNEPRNKTNRMRPRAHVLPSTGKTRFGVSDDAWMKSTVTFHVGSLWWFWKLTTAAGWTPWVWQLQCLLNVVFAAWGVQSMGGVDKLLKQD